jgi:hypothetical protein
MQCLQGRAEVSDSPVTFLKIPRTGSLGTVTVLHYESVTDSYVRNLDGV